MGALAMTSATDQPRPAVSDCEVLCPDCGYDLRGTDSQRCAECGLDVRALRASGQARFPWERRREIGAVRAYLHTVLMTMAHPKWFARAALMSGGYADARRFQMVSVLLGTLGLTASFAAAWWSSIESISSVGIWLPISLMAGLYISLLMMTGVPSYFFHPREFTIRRQNRCLALSYYASAPLVLAVPIALLSVGCFVLAENSPPLSVRHLLAQLIGSLLPMTIVAGLMFDLLHAARSLHLPARRRATCGLIVPLLWLLILLAGLIGLPGFVLYLLLIFFSLQ